MFPGRSGPSVFRQVFSDKCFQSVMRMFRTDARPRDTDV
jgi:hypothetical protein